MHIKEVIATKKYRHEWKHEISVADLLTLRSRLGAVMQSDEHAVDGVYTVRSLYFDNPEDKALREKLEGVSRREKFRLRFYGCDTENTHLEKKSKHAGLGFKETAPVSAEEVRLILAGDTGWMAASPQALVRELGEKMLREGLRPRSVVIYEREPFVFPAGNVRVTMDYDLRMALRPEDFLWPDAPTVVPPESPIILEVKWDEFLPDIIRDAVQLPGRHTAPYSKYAACRIYG